jgi:hypothetical protein
MSMTANRRSSTVRSAAVSGFPLAGFVAGWPLNIPAVTVTSRTAATTVTDNQAGISGAHPAPEPCSACSTSLTPMKAQMIPRPLFR